MTITATQARTHGELDCIDVETMLQETTVENADLRARLALALETRESIEAGLDAARLESSRLRALLDDVSAKNSHLAAERDSLTCQVKILTDELDAAEGDTVPAGTLLYATLSRADMTAAYRAASRITRGPLPPAVTQAVQEASSDVIAAMNQAGADALHAIMRREVRRRRRSTTRRRG